MSDALLQYRSQFPVLRDANYLISNSLGAMPQAAYDALYEYAETWATRGVRAWQEKWWGLTREFGEWIAPLLNAPRASLIWQPNVTLAHATIFSCIEFTNGRKKIVNDDMHFPSILYLCEEQRARGAVIETVHSDDGITIDQQKLLDAIDDETALVVISHVLFKSAFIQAARAVCEKAQRVGAQVILDGYQAVGTIPVDVEKLNADFYIGGCLKWLCGGPGNAFLYVRPDLISELQPRLVGWFAHARPFDFETGAIDPIDSIAKFQTGTPAIPALYAARPGLEIIREIGIEKIRAKSVAQSARLIELADEYDFPVTTPRDPNLRGGTVAVNVEHGYEISKVLKDREFIVDYRPGAGIRLSPHFYTRDDELGAAMSEIRAIQESRAFEKYRARVRDTVT